MKPQKFKQTEIGLIPEDWEMRTIEEISSIVTDFVANGSFASLRKNVKYKDNPDFAVLIRTKDFNSNFNRKNFVYIDEHAYNFLNKTKLFGGEIIVTNVGEIGIVFQVPRLNKLMSLGPNSIMLKTKYKDDFYYYYLKSNFGQARLLSITTGSVQSKFNKTDFRKLKVPLPPLVEQSAIASILSSLDAKIELNNKMNKTLEAIGQSIFKKWFIDNPEKEKWIVSKIGKEFKTILGGTPDRINLKYWGGNINWINSGKVNEFRIFSPSEKITKLGLENSATKPLPKGTTVLAITGTTLGQVSRLEIDSCANQSVIGILENENISSEYIYFLIKESIQDIISYQTGGAQQHINKNDVDNFEFCLPDEKILQEYKKIILPLFRLISKNCFENQSLMQIRDVLLPKLMSGEIRVSKK